MPKGPMQKPINPPNAVVKVNVAVHKDALSGLVPDKNGWMMLPGGEDVAVTLELSPEAWRELGRLLHQNPEEPEWRLENQRFPEGYAATTWFDCLPSTDAVIYQGPGGYMHHGSNYLSVRIRKFSSVKDEQ